MPSKIPSSEPLERRTLFSIPAGFSQSQIASGIDSPTAMAAAPDGRIFLSEQKGNLRVIDHGVLQAAPFLTVATTSNVERGLLGVAVDPNFATNHYIYVYYTASTPTIHNRVSRFTADGDADSVVPGSEKVLLDLSDLGSDVHHNGGAMHFGPDGDLYIAVGDNIQPTQAQSLSSVFGKMLRIEPDGTIPTDNPFYNQTTGVNQAIWAIGLRNPFTFGFQPGTGLMYINDVGDDGDTATEEIDVGMAGANYGWPLIQGFRTDEAAPANYRDPIYGYQHGADGVNGIAIVGGAFYTPPAGAAHPFPAKYDDDYFFADFGAGYVKTIDTETHAVTGFLTGANQIVDMAVAADGSLVYVQRHSRTVYQIKYTGVNAPSIVDQPQSQTVSIGQSATFKVNASGQGTLSYQWLRDGEVISGATAATYKLTGATLDDSSAVFSVQVTAGGVSTTSAGATLTVTENQPPTPVIAKPAAGAKFIAGKAVAFSGSATDPEDGAIAASDLTWSISYFTDGVERPYLNAFSGKSSGSFIPETVTPYLGTNVFFRIYLTATDSDGRSTTVSRDVLPTVQTFKLATNIAGLQVALDGTPQNTPLSVASVVGLQRGLSAPTSQVLNGVTYNFVSWSDGGAATHNISAPAAATTYTATYKAAGSTTGKSLTPLVDAYVAQGTPTTNFGAAAGLNVKKSTSAYDAITYLTFDLSGISSITSGILKLYGKSANTGVSVGIGAYKVSSTSWSEKSITYNNRPPLGALITSTAVKSSAAWYQWDVTSYLKSAKAAGQTKVTIALYGLAKTPSLTTFNSREAAVNRPVLVVG